MTEIERKALALLNEVRAEYPLVSSEVASNLALCRAIEQHEAYKQEVSDAVEEWHNRWVGAGESHSYFMSLFSRFIISKPDPLEEAVEDWIINREFGEDAASLRAAIEKRGGKIVWGEG